MDVVKAWSSSVRPWMSCSVMRLGVVWDLRSRGYTAQNLDVIRNEVFASGSLRRSGLR